MWPDRVWNPRPLTYKSVALPTALRGPARLDINRLVMRKVGVIGRNTVKSTDIFWQRRCVAAAMLI